MGGFQVCVYQAFTEIPAWSFGPWTPRERENNAGTSKISHGSQNYKWKGKPRKKRINRISTSKWATVEVTTNHRPWVARNGTGSSHWKGEWTLHPSRPLPCVCVCVCVSVCVCVYTHAPTLMEGGPEGGRRGGEDWENRQQSSYTTEHWTNSASHSAPQLCLSHVTGLAWFIQSSGPQSPHLSNKNPALSKAPW